ncbi:MAG: hypothetical protein ACD_67C00203G0004 [uncultured bacterium]|nr:MAG: hypothetical protein ACD_67C00203G0004 [uncultured bacterium]
MCPTPGIYAVTSIPFVSRTLAIFRRAELGFFGVVVLTLIQTPRLKGFTVFFGLFCKVLKVIVIAGDFVFFTADVRLFFTN